MKKAMTMTALVIASGTLLFMGACDKSGVTDDQPDPPRQMADPGMPVPSEMPLEGDASLQPAPIRTVLDEEVRSRWKAVEITVAEKKEGGQEFKVEIPIGGEATVEGTPFRIKLLGFVPDFAMGADTIATKSLDAVNPAAKIEVFEGEEVLFTGWSFRDFPGMHSFDDPRFTIALSRAVPVE